MTVTPPNPHTLATRRARLIALMARIEARLAAEAKEKAA